MPVVTAIDRSAKDPRRGVLRVDGRRVGELPLSVLAKLGLAVGMDFDAAAEKAVTQAVAADRAARTGLRRLNRQPYSRAVLREKLEAGGHDAAAVDAAVEKLEAIGALDERALGEALVARALRTGQAMPALRQALERKRLAPELIEELVAEAAAAFDPRQAARDLLDQKLQGAAGREEPARLWRRMAGMLGRKGFDEDVIRDVLDERLGDAGMW